MAGQQTSVGKPSGKEGGTRDTGRMRNKGVTPEEKRVVSVLQSADQKIPDLSKIELVREWDSVQRGDDLPPWTTHATENGFYLMWADNQAGYGNIEEVLSRRLKVVASNDNPTWEYADGVPIYRPVNRSSPADISSRIPEGSLDDTYGCVTKRHASGVVQFLVWTTKELRAKDTGWVGELSQATYRNEMIQARERGKQEGYEVGPAGMGDTAHPTAFATHHPVDTPNAQVTPDDMRQAGFQPGTDPTLGVQVEVGSDA